MGEMGAVTLSESLQVTEPLPLSLCCTTVVPFAGCQSDASQVLSQLSEAVYSSLPHGLVHLPLHDVAGMESCLQRTLTVQRYIDR